MGLSLFCLLFTLTSFTNKNGESGEYAELCAGGGSEWAFREQLNAHQSPGGHGVVGRPEEGGAAGRSQSWKPRAVTSRDEVSVALTESTCRP